MANLNCYTHELICEDTILFKDDTKYQEVITKYFEEVYKIKTVIGENNSTLIAVRGRRHLYGYLVDEGGFYDLFNQVYYDENSNVFKNGTIYKCSYKKKILN